MIGKFNLVVQLKVIRLQILLHTIATLGMIPWSATANVVSLLTTTFFLLSTAATGNPGSPTLQRCLSSKKIKFVILLNLTANSFS